MADVTSWLPNLLGPIDIFVNGAATGVPRRPAYNFIGSGITVVDNPSADRIDITIPAGGAAPTGTGFRHVTSGTEDGAARAVNLVSDVTGVLPTGNQASQSIGGDGSGTTAALTVTKIQGNAVASGALTAGQPLRATGSAAAAFGALDLANANAVTGVLPFANLPGLGAFHVVRAVATSNVASLSGTTTIDGVALIAGDRLLLQNQTTASQNGIYVIAAGTWSRASDWNTGGPALAENWIAVSEGTTGAHTIWRVTTQGAITVGLTSVAIAQYTTVAPDATTGAKGIVQLATDLAGTATAPVVQQITGVSGAFTVVATKETWSSTANSYVISYIFTTVTTSTTANQTIATIPTATNSGMNKLDIVISASVTTPSVGSSFYSISMDTSYFENGGSVPVIVGTDTLGTAKNSSAGTPAPATSASGHNVLLKVTPWTASSITWTVVVQQTVAV